MFSDFVSCVGAQCVWCVCVFTSVYTSCTFLWLFFFFFSVCFVLFRFVYFYFISFYVLVCFLLGEKKASGFGQGGGEDLGGVGWGETMIRTQFEKKKKQELLSMKKKDLFILIIYVWVFACLYVCVHRVNDWPLRRPEGSTGSPGAGIIAGCESPSRCWKPNPGPPQKQQVCVARDTSLQLLNSIWEGTWDERLL